MNAVPTPFSDSTHAFARAIEIAGSQTELARICGCTPANISQLIRAGKSISPQFVLKVEAATGISRHDLRPDLYPRDLPPAPDSLASANPAPAVPSATIPADRAPAASSPALSLPQGDEAGGGRGSERNAAGHGDRSLAPGAAVR